MIELLIPGRKAIQLPSQFSELNYWDYIKISGLVARLQKKEITLPEFDVLCVYELLEMVHTGKDINFDNFALVAEKLRFFKTDEKKENTKVIDLDFTDNKIPNFHLHNTLYYGPTQGMGDCSFYEFIYAHSYYIDFISTGNTNSLDHIVAALYRKQSKKERREKFNDETVKERIQTFTCLNYNMKFGIFLFFQSVMQSIISHHRYSLIFKRDDNETDTEGLGLIGTVYNLQERNLSENLNYLYNTLDILWKDKLQYLEMQEKTKSR